LDYSPHFAPTCEGRQPLFGEIGLPLQILAPRQNRQLSGFIHVHLNKFNFSQAINLLWTIHPKA
jgi:hypothetical protein